MATCKNIISLQDFLVKEAPPSVYYIPNYITEEKESYLLKQVYSAPQPKWTQLSHRRLQNWGGLPHVKGMIKEELPKVSLLFLWLNELTTDIGSMCSDIFEGKTPNHVLINEYQPGQGIMPHEDGPLYHPVVTTVSLGCHTLLDFYSPLTNTAENEQESDLGKRYQFSLLLERCSLLILHKDMYKHYLHGIAERDHDIVTDSIINLHYCSNYKSSLGETITRSDPRVSLTIRHVPKVLKIRIK